MKKRIDVATTDKRQFVKDVLELGVLGATLPDNVGVFGGVVLRTTLEVEEDVVVPQRPSVRVCPISKKEREEYMRQQAQKNVIPVKNPGGEEVSIAKKSGKKKE